MVMKVNEIIQMKQDVCLRNLVLGFFCDFVPCPISWTISCAKRNCAPRPQEGESQCKSALTVRREEKAPQKKGRDVVVVVRKRMDRKVVVVALKDKR
jgi:hypothetical protein